MRFEPHRLLPDALIRLGFPALNKLPPDHAHLYKDYAARVFDTSGARAIVKSHLARFDPDREAICFLLT